MKKILLFAGTTEGRLLASKAGELCLDCYVSTATEYGKEILRDIKGVQVLSGRMEEAEIVKFIRMEEIELVIDATHPFACAVTENIRKACEETRCEYLRCLRQREQTSGTDGKKKVFCDVRTAVEFLKHTDGNILIATGGKELKEYTKIPGDEKRCYARVLSTLASVEQATALGFEGKHLIAMQGPFSKELNTALLHQIQAKYFVTKESGQAGGFAEKVKAAKETGALLVVIARPQEKGKSLEEVLRYLETWKDSFIGR